jgi:hypothetical protein
MADRVLGSDVPPVGDESGPMARLMRQEQYTPQELADLLDMPLTLITHDAFAGKLPARIVEHDIVSIRREDVIAWLNRRG